MSGTNPTTLRFSRRAGEAFHGIDYAISIERAKGGTFRLASTAKWALVLSIALVVATL